MLLNFRYVVFGMRYSICGIQYSVFGIRYAVCGMRYAVCKCTWDVFFAPTLWWDATYMIISKFFVNSMAFVFAFTSIGAWIDRLPTFTFAFTFACTFAFTFAFAFTFTFTFAFAFTFAFTFTFRHIEAPQCVFSCFSNCYCIRSHIPHIRNIGFTGHLTQPFLKPHSSVMPVIVISHQSQPLSQRTRWGAPSPSPHPLPKELQATHHHSTITP